MATAGELRRIANRILDQLQGFDDDDEIETYGNTYYIHDESGKILETRDGFVDWTNIQIDDWEPESDDDDSYSVRSKIGAKKAPSRKPVSRSRRAAKAPARRR